MDFLHKVDTAYHSKQSRPFSSNVDNIHKYVPSIREQLQDWEDGLCENDADGSFLHENWNNDLRLFSDGEDGAPKLLQLFVLRAEHEIQAASGDLQNLNSIKSKMHILFGGSIRASSRSPIPLTEPLDTQQDRTEVFTPKHPGIGSRTWADVHYKGDWMRRPISDNEVAWLARILIRLSDFLNDFLGLDHRVCNGEPDGPNFVDVPRESGYVGGSKEAMAMVLSYIGSSVSWTVKFMRGRGMRINLRVLASKKFVMVLVAYVVVFVLKKALFS
ncbi:uncharacterized protein A4U43_C10F11770 [Asparagus officinalis]|uniref:Uncharacterized protein n=2 Tax=Asparagus officinalis TaxID=4686 RepID=A0A5P1E5E7_ASPOF|nr:uncharacterized protein A4U43_C10F11770 [Asparagus officinalis]